MALSTQNTTSPFQKPPTLGYHKIRGLAAPLRMMLHYKSQPYVEKAYATDMKAQWFAGEKQKLIEKNAMINLPYIIDNDISESENNLNAVITQSNTCALYLGRKLGIDQVTTSVDGGLDIFIRNHSVLDQTMDWRNDLMDIVYPFAGKVPTPNDYKESKAKEYMEGTVKTHVKKLEGFLKQRIVATAVGGGETGVFMCGSTPLSGDFMLFEMLDQHCWMAVHLGLNGMSPSEMTIDTPYNPWLESLAPHLFQLWKKMRFEIPELQKYFGSSEQYREWAFNNGLFTHFTGRGDGFSYGDTVEMVVG